MSSSSSRTITVPRRWLAVPPIVGALVGFGLAFLVGPGVQWLVDLIGGAPGPLRLAASLPLAWAVPVLTLLGAGGGVWVSAAWQKEIGSLTVTASEPRWRSSTTPGRARRIPMGSTSASGSMGHPGSTSAPTPCCANANGRSQTNAPARPMPPGRVCGRWAWWSGTTARIRKSAPPLEKADPARA